MRNAIIRRCMALAMAITCLLAVPAAAWAHAQLLSAEPADSAVLAASPPMLTLHFNEPVSPLAISLIGPDGRAADLLDQVSGSDTIAIAMPADLATGSHVLSWRVVSIDGHPIAGAQVFS
ncbi:MAG: copper resistance protein CopC, partial [Alphaproteobacteria bacterium]|nr:copper resistance protein CopC [Alphaproteobacteria bacterium]